MVWQLNDRLKDCSALGLTENMHGTFETCEFELPKQTLEKSMTDGDDLAFWYVLLKRGMLLQSSKLTYRFIINLLVNEQSNQQLSSFAHVDMVKMTNCCLQRMVRLVGANRKITGAQISTGSNRGLHENISEWSRGTHQQRSTLVVTHVYTYSINYYYISFSINHHHNVAWVCRLCR